MTRRGAAVQVVRRSYSRPTRVRYSRPVAGVEGPDEHRGIRPLGPLRRRRDGSLRGVLTDRAAIERVMVDAARSFHKGRGVRLLRPALGNGIFTSEGDT